MRLDAALLLAALAGSAAQPALAGPAPAPSAPAAPAGTVAKERGVRFVLPAGYLVKETTEREPGEEDDAVFVATRGRVEIRAEVEKGAFDCTPQAQAGKPRQGTVDGRPSCEVDVEAPPSSDPAIGARRAASVLVQFPGRHLSVLVFAPTQAEATALARQVAATCTEDQTPADPKK
jgi:hypothetical protein